MKKMTNEKAKECIDAIIGTWEICQNQKYPSAVDVEIDAEDIVALKMAITALSQELCTDAISRQAAIDAIENTKSAKSEDGEIYVAKINAEMNIQLLPSVSYSEKTNRCEDAVSRELVKKDIARWIGYIDEDMIARMHITIDKLPSVSVAEKIGKWKKRWGDSRTICPFCNALNFSKYKNFCPNCGAKMEVTE